MDPRAARSLDLNGSLGALLAFLSNRLTASGSATYRSRFGLGILDARLLMMLGAEPDISPGRICDVTGFDGGAVSRALRALAARDLVVARPDPRNPNYKYWSLTDEGIRLQDEIVLVSIARDEMLLDGLDAAASAALVDVVRQMLAKAEALRPAADRGA